jgi:uncharacterized protein (TIGR02145 family)
MLILLSACIKRDFDNPYDLDSENTEFTLSNFNAEWDGYSKVIISWEAPKWNYYKTAITRTTLAGISEVIFEIKNEFVDSFEDTQAKPNETYVYNISLQRFHDDVVLSDSDVALTKLDGISEFSHEVSGNIVLLKWKCVNSSTEKVRISRSFNGDWDQKILNLDAELGEFQDVLDQYGTFNYSICAVEDFVYRSDTIQSGKFEFTNCPESIIYGGENYTVVPIGLQCWIKENINYSTSNSYAYHNMGSYADNFGRLYSWDDAKIACPDGYHLPTDEDFKQLERFIGIDNVDDLGLRGEDIEYSLKSVDFWNSAISTDHYSFNALPGGYIKDTPTSSYAMGVYGFYWTASVDEETGNIIKRKFVDEKKGVYRELESLDNKYYSVKCIKD